MTVVRLPETAQTAIADHGRSSAGWVACGLLIGRPAGADIGIVRALRCVNSAPVEQRRTSFAIDPRALLNVRRSLERQALEILGFYYVSRDGGEALTEVDREHLSLWPDTLWLIAPASAPNGTIGQPRVWWRQRSWTEEKELVLKIESTRAPQLLACPE